MSDKLTNKQRRFVHEYCTNGFNGKQAAIKAGYSEETAKNIACENLTKPYLQEEIQKFMEEIKSKALVTVEDVVNGLLTEAQCNGEGSSQSARVSAWKALTDYTGGFDANKQKIEHSGSVGTLTDDQINERLEALIAGFK